MVENSSETHNPPLAIPARSAVGSESPAAVNLTAATLHLINLISRGRGKKKQSNKKSSTGDLAVDSSSTTVCKSNQRSPPEMLIK